MIQLNRPFDLGIIIPEDDSVRLLSQFVDELDLKDLYHTYSRIRENRATPRQLLNRIYSARDAERACKRVINFMYLLDGQKAPNHSTIARFKSLHFSLIAKDIMAKFTNRLYELGEISGKTIFIDGTKSVKSSYECEDCTSCPHKSDCMKGNNWKVPLEERTKNIVLSKSFMSYREQDLERILSPEGIELRINRSIQAEGSYAQIKQDMGFRRFLSKPHLINKSA